MFERIFRFFWPKPIYERYLQDLQITVEDVRKARDVMIGVRPAPTLSPEAQAYFDRLDITKTKTFKEMLARHYRHV